MNDSADAEREVDAGASLWRGDNGRGVECGRRAAGGRNSGRVMRLAAGGEGGEDSSRRTG